MSVWNGDVCYVTLTQRESGCTDMCADTVVFQSFKL